MNEREPVFKSVPPIVIALTVIIGAVEIGIYILERPIFQGVRWLQRSDLYATFGFDPLVFRFKLLMATEFQDTMSILSGTPISLLTYPWLHHSLGSAVFNIMVILCIGSLLAKIAHQWAVVAVFCLSTIIGGLAYSVVPETAIFLIGSTPGALGMLGLFGGLMIIEYGKGNPFASPTLIGLPFLITGLEVVIDVLFGPAGYWSASAAGFITGVTLPLLTVRKGFALFRSGLKRLFSE